MNNRPSRQPIRRRHGFTVIEILVVVGVIILLLSILVVALNKAVEAAQSSNTANLMKSLNEGLVRFKDDMGYYPPVLGGDPPPTVANQWRDLLEPPNPTPLPDYITNIQKWYSITTLADYLVGYGDDSEDAYDGLGIRSPGRDGVWGGRLDPDGDGIRGEFTEQNSTAVFGTGESKGQVFGPYIELKDDRLLGSIDGSDPDGDGNPEVFFPGDPGYDQNDPKVLVDYWGTPIRYYRRAYPTGSLKASHRQYVQDRLPPPGGDGTLDSFPTLSDVFALRPFNIPAGIEVDGLPDNSSIVPGGDTSTTFELNSAEFALLSAGPDKVIDPETRVDDEQRNRDNVVEVGP